VYVVKKVKHEVDNASESKDVEFEFYKVVLKTESNDVHGAHSRRSCDSVKDTIRPEDSASNVSKSSSKVSRISLAKAKEIQRKAEALARSESLRKTRSLELAKPDLKLQEEELKFNTEIKVAEAR
jgi:hypothetical protein